MAEDKMKKASEELVNRLLKLYKQEMDTATLTKELNSIIGQAMACGSFYTR